MHVFLFIVLVVLALWLTVAMAGGMMSLITALVIGAVAGWLSGQLTRGHGFGILKNTLIGMIGALIGGILLPLVGLHAMGIIGSLASATLGAVMLLYAIRWVRTA